MDIDKLINIIKSNRVHDFYISTEWLSVRNKVLAEQHNECQICKSKGKYSKGDTVHHILHLKKRPDLALTKSNLMVVCRECHKEIHYGVAKPQLNKERW